MKKIDWNTKSISANIKEKLESGNLRAAGYVYPTGFDKLDNELNGGISSGLYCIGALPGLGKSTFIMQVAENLSANGIPVVVFSLEMDMDHLSIKALDRQLYLSTKKHEHIGDEALVERVSMLSRNIYVIPYENSVDAMNEYIDDYVTNFEKAPVVIVDYLQMMKGQPNMTDKQVVDSNVLALKAMSARYNTSVIMISALNRDHYTDVTLKSFKDSGSIEYVADVILGMKYKDDKHGGEYKNIILNVLKQTYGRSNGKIELIFRPEYSYFEEKNDERKRVVY